MYSLDQTRNERPFIQQAALSIRGREHTVNLFIEKKVVSELKRKGSGEQQEAWDTQQVS